MIFSAVFVILFVTCLPNSEAGTTERNCTYEYVGCYRDNRTYAYDELYANFRGNKTYIQWGKPWSNFTNVIEGCCDALITKYPDNYYFGVQFYGECWTYKNNSFPYYTNHSESRNCIRADCNATDEVGKRHTNAIYCAFECGKKTAETRIVNGIKTTLPFMAGLYIPDPEKPNDHFYCGATLISCCWLLTAAHCFTHKANVAVIHHTELQGDYALLGDPRINKGRKYELDTVYIHDNYTGNTTLLKSNWWKYDVALIRLKKVVKIDDEVHPICLNEEDDFAKTGKTYDTAGWGSVRFYNGTASPDLLKADVKLVDITNPKVYFTSGAAVNNNLGKGVCAGDSGGPYYNETSGKYIQVAVISGAQIVGGECARPNTIMDGTKVDVVKDWIDKIRKDHTPRLETLEPPEPVNLQ